MAAISANPPVRRFFGTGDAHSLKSFRGNTTPSLKSSSLKTRKSMNLLMPSLLGFKRGAQKQCPDVIYVNSVRRPEEFHACPSSPPAVEEIKVEETEIQPRKASLEVENRALQSDRPEPLRRSKSKALMRMISTTFRPPPSEPGRVPVPPADMASKANREAALRARGLLPPLHPNKDLSRWEHEQDRQLPVVPLAEETIIETAEGDVPRTVTAASLIKQEWVAKNRSDDTEPSRMKSFKFAGLPSVAPTIVEQATSSTDNLLPSLVGGQKVDEHILSLSEDEPASNVTPSPRSRPTPPRLTLDPHTVTTSDYLLSPQSPATPSKAEPRLIPLPPSPSLSPQRLQDSPISRPADPDDEQMTPLPPIPGTPTTLPAISLSPPPSALLNGSTNFSRSDSVQPSFLSESGSSDMTPSWDNSSQTMTVSSLNTSESLPSIGKPKINTLKVKVHDHHIPIILESPIEETPSKVSLLGPYIDDELCTATKLDDELPASSHGAATPSHTAAKADHKKTKSPVKRGQTLDPSTNAAAQKRLSMLSSMRRSVVGSLNRSKTVLSIGGKKKTSNGFDASHFPPSPTVPVSFAEQAKKFSPTRALFPSPRTYDGPAARVAAAPTIHSRGTILDEMMHITDDETRRVTELAFLG